jgi:hypothetical protein
VAAGWLPACRLFGHTAGAAAAAADACAPSFNWFPTAAEIGEDVVINNKTCTGKQVCNFPKVWSRANQTQYMPQLGTSLSNGLLKVAFKQFGNQPPRLFFTPVSEFLEAGADVSACASSRPPTTRHLLATAKVRGARWVWQWAAAACSNSGERQAAVVTVSTTTHSGLAGGVRASGSAAWWLGPPPAPSP